MPIKTKRWNDPIEKEDGYRLLICRYRPRGVKKENEPWDAWCIALSPSVDLHAAVYGKNDQPAIPWEEYERRFFEEMKRQSYWLKSFATRIQSGETITLLCSSACTDESRCHRTLVKKLLTALADDRHGEPTRSTRVVRRPLNR